jgi:hypothetical protein
MSGLLHRLAAEAIGAAKPSVHPVVRMRHMPAPELIEEPGGAPTLGPPSQPASEREAFPSSTGVREPAPVSRYEAGPSALPSRSKGVNARGRAARAGEGACGEPGESRVPPSPDRGGPSDSSIPPTPSEIGVQDSSPGEAPELVREEIDLRTGPGEPKPLRGRAPVSPTHPATLATRRLREPPRIPTPLIWHGVDPAHPRWRRSDLADRVSEAARRAGGEPSVPSEVHVHIDRVEVTAVREAPPPQPPRPERRKPMSLDEYLSKRGGRSG